jgi:YebC/PmpR family DNA-binding regulatory protein
MSGHSKWSKIKRKKGATDSKRSKVFSKLIKEIQVAAKMGGPDPETNPRLRLAIQNGKSENLPKENIDRAIKKAAGEDNTQYTEVSYEGYAPHGVALYIECMTDNTNRTVANIRALFNKFNGSLAKTGSLSHIFDHKGIFSFPLPEMDKDELQLELIDAGAEDIDIEDNYVNVTSAREDFGRIQKKLEELKIEVENAGLQRIPVMTKKLTVTEFQSAMKLIDYIEDDDDVQNIYHNIEITEELESSLE